MRKTLTVVLLAASISCSAEVKEEVVTVASRNATQSYLLSRENTGAVQTVYILFSGGAGEHKLSQRGEVVQVFNDQKFLARARKLFVAGDSAAVLLDAPSDKPFMDDAFRTGDKHAADISAVIADVRARFASPRIVFVGHSNGSISAATIAAGMPAEEFKVVLVNGRLVKHWYAGDALSAFDFGQLKGRVLLLHHAKDGCSITPYEGAMALSDRVPLVTLQGPEGVPASGCNGGTHNLTGKDQEAVGAIVDWVNGRSPA
jgi:hypothetical protein